MVEGSRRGRKWFVAALLWLLDQFGSNLLGGAVVVLLGWLSLTPDEVKSFVASHPGAAAVGLAVALLAAHGLADLSMKAWRWLRRPSPTAPAPTGPTAPATAPAPTRPAPAPHWFDWIVGDLPNLGIRARWGWNGRDATAARALCPQCSMLMEPTPARDESGGTFPRTLVECPYGHFQKVFPEIPRSFPARLEREIMGIRDDGRWKASLEAERAREESRR